MALQGSIVLDNGIALTNVYIEINRVIFSYADINDSTATDISVVSVDVEIYKDLKAYNSEKPIVLSVTHICKGLDLDIYFSDYKFNSSGVNPIILAYEWLMNDIYIDADIIWRILKIMNSFIFKH